MSIDSILYYMEEKQTNDVVIAFDQEKTFDRVEHNYIKNVLYNLVVRMNIYKMDQYTI